MNEVISIIIPVYRVEKYVAKCLESVIHQSYQNLEIIVIDDGSPDRAGEICDEYARMDSRIKVIHQKNQGLSAARNRGIHEATGDYIGFVDSDDYVLPQMYESMLKAIQENDADICICDYIECNEGQEDIELKGIQGTESVQMITTKKEKIKYSYLEKYVHAIVVWNKLYKREIWDKFLMPEIKAYEDEAIMYQVLYEAKSIAYLHEELYVYLRRKSGSITSSDFSERRMLRLDVLQEKMNFYRDKKEWEFFLEALFVYKTDILKVTYLIEKSNEYSLEMIEPYKKIYNRYCIRYLMVKCKTSFQNKLSYLWYAFFPKMYLAHLAKK